MRFLLRAGCLVAALAVTPALACSPAPSCWMDESRAYLQQMCKQVAARGLKEQAGFVDEPAKLPAFARACRQKFGIRIRR